MRTRFSIQEAQALMRAGAAYASGDGRGLAGSLFLHGLLAALILLLMFWRGMNLAQTVAPPHLVPVEVIRLGAETTSPPEPLKAKIPQPVTHRAAPHEPASANRPEGTSPTGRKPVDDLETRLNALAHLKAPESNVKPVDTPSATEPASSSDAAPGAMAAYAVRDLIRAQVLRKWTFNAPSLGASSFQIALRVTVLKNGTVEHVAILDRERYTRDALYRDIALSARNAVLLSSPLTLPPGAIDYSMDVTLNLNPRDALR
jgi:hypothetical protein